MPGTRDLHVRHQLVVRLVTNDVRVGPEESERTYVAIADAGLGRPVP
ncbi:MAG: hypothetical protein H0V20_10420 [Actinobacteria bacterium]|nr:hypothetical protein [Actinomycetota bacterium]